MFAATDYQRDVASGDLLVLLIGLICTAYLVYKLVCFLTAWCRGELNIKKWTNDAVGGINSQKGVECFTAKGRMSLSEFLHDKNSPRPRDPFILIIYDKPTRLSGDLKNDQYFVVDQEGRRKWRITNQSLALSDPYVYIRDHDQASIRFDGKTRDEVLTKIITFVTNFPGVDQYWIKRLAKDVAPALLKTQDAFGGGASETVKTVRSILEVGIPDFVYYDVPLIESCEVIDNKTEVSNPTT